MPLRAGIGLKAEHYRMIIETSPDIGFFEVHAENYMGAGGPPHRYLSAIRERYPLSLHGVGLSIGAARPLDRSTGSTFSASRGLSSVTPRPCSRSTSLGRPMTPAS
jgi:uncharacterized protein (UPF0276 family)